MIEDNYIKILNKESDYTKDYYQKFFDKKSEQQKFLEKLLSQKSLKPKNIADIACGGGSLTHHLSKIYTDAEYTLVDLNDEAIALANQNLKGLNAKFLTESIYDLKSIPDNYFDLVFCWQTLSWIESIKHAVEELIRITKKNGFIYCSALFNINHDVDILSKVYDHTKKSAREGLSANYFTYSKYTISKIISAKIKRFEIYEFNPNIDFEYHGNGLGTYTLKTEGGNRLQLSGGLLMNWGILEIEK